ncbi:MAG TPA: hypothetical protein VHU86_02390 [Solirubrobacterales bacterium]|jgi:hypothetical protein|nr:hypothetical protein [Solirubrobacterales bacterium]
MSRLRVVLALGVVAALALALIPGPAQGERAQSGNLIVTLNGGIAPLKLPRRQPAPVAVHLEGKIGTADGSPLPQVKQVKIELAGPGLLFTHGLAVCPQARLRNANDGQALNRCGPALVGRGSLTAQVLIPNQAPFAIHTRLLAFNGRTAAGRTAIWVHAFSSDPPVSLVLPFVVHPGSEAFPTILVATVPRSVGPLPHLAVFHLRLYRRFSYRGRRRSYISATCPVPPSFTAGFLSFARATYSFAGNRRLGIESVRSCRAR